MKIYLTRHGQTDWNKQQIIQGRTDNDLNAVGLSEAASLKAFYARINPDLIISSSLSRAVQTATIATGQKPQIIDDRFIERDFGYFDGRKIQDFYDVEDPREFEGFESNQAIIDRVSEGIQAYCHTEYECIAIFAHSHVLKAALSILAPDKYNFTSNIKNCAIVEIDVTDDNIHLVTIH